MMNKEQIDLVLPWVDGGDLIWQAEKNKYDKTKTVSNVRYQSWDNLQYLFRGIEKYISWVDKIFFITWGHIPEWLNTSHEKIRIVKHSDYIPSQYLPTFNSNVIEMNYFRIEELSENFILFNDDLFPVQPISQEYYFQNGMPCEEAVETHFILKADKGMDLQMNYACVNNMVLLNRNFDKRQVVRENRDKWFSPVYGKRLQQNINLEFWNNFESFVYPHEAMPMKKSALKEIWEKEPEFLDRASHNKFRAYSDVTQRLITMWQICSGKFVPHKYQGKMFLVDEENYLEAADAIRNRKYPIISLNETGSGNFEMIKTQINRALYELFPQKSDFEI
ncbi:MAG: hypothetical protein HFH79_03040 [Lachnospiraceae bacterium]|nr:hypothetical protein [Lachnospiraceae bacterium]